MGGWLRHCGYYPSWNLRFFLHQKGRYEKLSSVAQTNSGDNEVHEHVELQGRSKHLIGELEHYAFPSIATWVEKHNRYSDWEAQVDSHQEASQSKHLTPSLRRKRVLKSIARRLPFRPTTRFLYHYVFRLGFLDGYRGFVFCRLMGIYEFLSVAKAAENLTVAPDRDSP